MIKLFILLAIGCYTNSEQFHSFSSLDINGNKLKLEDLAGKVVLIVNVASECGYTDSHYTALQQLYQLLKPTGYPCNQFGAQEPGSRHQIKEFIKQYSVSFNIMDKVEVVGKNADPVWKYLVQSSGMSPKWNFYKYLVGGEGEVLQVWGPDVPVHDILDVVQAAVDHLDQPQVQMERPLSAEEIAHDEL
ncbi:glutathione peroxidase 7 isoform X2 [Eurytemora carolleeae]|uniref:glutathione peroxidase 7 isoform X2 n=1 Tax=Eurytemora carolleeae TaxID=1294199 RepID=UPI000C7855E9|nr:glutathione peroxidase 7 isoform X2 [Eurytemora carolleeae]|eukprot:XP_023334137.1 glutathione peroxidase 7-like isoform X2 [Eurytemora affinis]